MYHVTNLNDSGAGSFREAVSASNRIVVFDVGGYIALKTAVSAKSTLTIAGQTAPGGGIGFKGGEISFASSSNIIAGYLRITELTFQDDLIADPTAQQFGAHTESVASQWAWYRNIFASSHNRNPLAKVDNVFVNNVLYNCSAGYTTHTSTNFATTSWRTISSSALPPPARTTLGTRWTRTRALITPATATTTNRTVVSMARPPLPTGTKALAPS